MKKKREEKRKLEHQIVKSPEILNLCDRRRERNDLNRKGLRNTGKYNTKRCMKKANENWIGEQCSKIEENLRKNSSKRAYKLVKDLTTLKQGKATTVQDVQENVSQKKERY